MIPRFRLLLASCSLIAVPWPSVSAAPIAGSDFSNAAVFNAAGGAYDNALTSTDDLNLLDNVTVSDWILGNGALFVGFDAAAQVGMPNTPVTKIDGNATARPAVGFVPGATLASVSFSITIPVGTIVNLTSADWVSRQATGTAGQNRWIAFKTSLDAGLTYSQVGSLRPAFDSVSVDLTGAAYQELTNTTVTFSWYAGGGGSGDMDFDTPTINGTVSGVATTPPTVINSGATNIAPASATLGGEVTATGGANPNVTLYWGDNDGGTTPGSWDDAVNIGAQSGAFTTDLFGLTHNTTYYFRAFAQNSGGSAWAPSTESFTTNAFLPPSVTNNAASNITGAAAQVGGSVTSSGGDPPMVTIYWGDHDAGTNAGAWDGSIPLGAQSSGFSSVLTGLSSLTTYYFRAHAQNAAGAVWAGSTASFTTLEVSELVLNEFMAANNGGLSNNPNGWYPIANQVAGTTDDWIEILNTGASTLDLGGWHLTDDAANLSKWTFPASTRLAPGGFLIVYASGHGTPDANGNPHTNFKLAAGGEYLALVRPTGSVASEFNPGGTNYPSQDNDRSFGLHPTTSASVYFASPTPGAANAASGIATVGDTSFSPDRGYYQTAIAVTITSKTPGATIYYTTDGSPPVDGNGSPTATATLYTAPVPISRTTPLRASATKAGFAPTNIDTQTYLLLDIDNANADGTDSAGLNTPFLQQTQPPGWGNLSSGDYNMDPTVSKATAIATNHTTSTARTMLLGLRDIPTISIAMNRADFSGTSGIYTNSTNGSLEYACSAEFIPATGDTRKDWQINCGIKVQGGASRNPASSPKHSLNFRFRDAYGNGRLRQPLFPGSEVEEFNSITLRAGYNNSWIHNDAAQRGRASMIRDQWMRESMLDMGNPAAGHGFMVHVFINGLYWGVHNLSERPEASHYAAYNGGDDSLLDARNAGATTDGNTTAYNAMTALIAATGTAGYWTKVQGVLAIDQYIDYQIINRYGANADLSAGNNWRSAGGGPFPVGQPEQMAPWQIYSWDGERTLESQSATNIPTDPVGVRGTLEGNAEYRIRFADRLQKHFFNGGALTPESTKARWMKFATILDRAIIAESARWGDHRGTLYTRDNQWLAEQARLYNTYFPVRSATVLAAYGSLFPATSAPAFLVNGAPQHGGILPVGGTLRFAAASGTIHYTTDGSDPRLEGGSLNPTASPITGGTNIPLATSSLLRARVLNNGEWSPLSEAQFIRAPIADASNIVVSAFMYNPAGTSEDTEWIELMNISPTATIDLTDLAFTGIDYRFPRGVTLAPGARIVVVKNQLAFAAAYNTAGLTIAPGEFSTTSLDNTGEQLALIDATGTDARRFTYNDKAPWPTAPDGDGYALVLIAPETSPDHRLATNWRSSAALGGSPGTTDAIRFTGDPYRDDDGDGLSAFLEHALGSPGGDASGSPESSPVVGSGPFANGAGGTAAYLTFTYRRNLAADDVLYEVQIAPDLETWSALGTVRVSASANGDGTESVTYRSTAPLANIAREFIRLRVTSRP